MSTFFGGRSSANRGRYNNYRGGFGGGNRPRARGADEYSYTSPTGETAIHEACKYYARDGVCRFNENCRNSHILSIIFSVKAHEKAIKAMNVLLTTGTPLIMTGSEDATIKVWNLSRDPNGPPEHEIKAKGSVSSIELSGNTVMWSGEENLEGDPTGVPVGVVHLLNQETMSTQPITRSKELPYTHPQQVRAFKIVAVNGETFVVTSGGEGLIRTWRYDAAQQKFEPLAVLEGHTRGVTSLVLHETRLWSGSSDRTIRVWEIGTGQCLGVLSSATFGHKDVVSCLELIPGSGGVGPEGNETFIASAGAEGDLKLWRSNGEFTHSISHGVFITAMKYFQDEFGGPAMLVLGFLDGRVMLRSCATMTLLVSIDGSHHRGQPVLAIAGNIGQSCFATAGESGHLIVWRTLQAFSEK